MTKFHKSLRLRLIALSLVVLLGIIAVIHSAVYVKSINFIQDEITLSAQGIAVAATNYIMQDIETYKAFLEFVDEYKESQGYQPLDRMSVPMSLEHLTQSGEHSQYYRKMQEFFEKIKDCSHVKFIATKRKLCEEFLEFILDAEPIGSTYHTPPGATDPFDQGRRDLLATGLPTRFKLVYFDEWGYLLGAYAPIFDDDDNILGLIGVCICGSHFHNHLNQLQLVLFTIYAGIVGLVLFVLTRYSGAFLEPLLKDKLTGAYTKRYAEQLIQNEIATAVKTNSALALMMIDLDHFKKINDTYGHNFGDKVLSSVSQTIQTTLRHKDYFIRFGGEEFIALFSKVNEERALEIAERIRRSVEGSEILNEERDIPIKMTISIGVATLRDTAPSVLEFIEHADKALYIAKHDRNTVSLYTQETEIITAEKQEEYMKSSTLSSSGQKKGGR